MDCHNLGHPRAGVSRWRADGALITVVTAGPGIGIVKTGLSGRKALVGISSGEVIRCRCTVVVDVGTWAGASAGWLSEGSVAAVCAMVCCGRGVSSEDVIETAFARSNRNRYINKVR